MVAAYQNDSQIITLPARDAFAMPPNIVMQTIGLFGSIPISGSPIELLIMPLEAGATELPPSPPLHVPASWLIGNLMTMHSPRIPQLWDNVTLWMPFGEFSKDGSACKAVLTCSTRRDRPKSDPTGRTWAVNYANLAALRDGSHAVVFIHQSCVARHTGA